MSEVTTPAAGHDEHHGMAHVMPIPILIAVFLALLFLTLATVVANDFELGAAELWISMGIATVKASLVGIYFMHLRYDRLFNAFAFLSSVVFLALFVSFAVLDTKAYQGDLKSFQMSPYGQTPEPVSTATAQKQAQAETSQPAAGHATPASPTPASITPTSK